MSSGQMVTGFERHSYLPFDVRQNVANLLVGPQNARSAWIADRIEMA